MHPHPYLEPDLNGMYPRVPLVPYQYYIMGCGLTNKLELVPSSIHRMRVENSGDVTPELIYNRQINLNEYFFSNVHNWHLFLSIAKAFIPSLKYFLSQSVVQVGNNFNCDSLCIFMSVCTDNSI